MIIYYGIRVDSLEFDSYLTFLKLLGLSGSLSNSLENSFVFFFFFELSKSQTKILI